MNYYVLILTCLLGNFLFGMQKVAHSETLVPGGRSEITSYLHILPKDVEELVAQLLIHAHPALFLPISRVLSGHTDWITLSSSDTRWKVGLNGISRYTLHDSGIFQMLLVVLVFFKGIAEENCRSNHT